MSQLLLCTWLWDQNSNKSLTRRILFCALKKFEEEWVLVTLVLASDLHTACLFASLSMMMILQTNIMKFPFLLLA